MLHPRFQRLLEGYELAQDRPPGDLAKAVRSLPRVGRLPSPWETTVLTVGFAYRLPTLDEVMEDEELCIHGRDFVVFKGFRRRGPRCSAAASSPAAIEPSLGYQMSGDIPPIEPTFHYGLTEEFMASFGLLLRDDFLELDESDLGHFSHPSMARLTIEAVDLVEAGVLVPGWFDPPNRWAFAVGDLVLEHAAAINEFFQGTEDPRVRLWRHACVGDWIAAHDAALAMGNVMLGKLTGERAEQCREDRLDRIQLQVGRDGAVTPRVLMALGDLDPAYATPHLAEALTVGHPAVRTALKFVAGRGDPAWCPAVGKLFRSLGSVDDPDQVADLANACEQFLDRHGFRPTGAMISTPNGMTKFVERESP
jgi:hypothetical protein